MDWAHDLLHSTKNKKLQHFYLFGNINEQLWHELCWPSLHTVEFYCVHLPHDALVNFIETHNTTLSRVALIEVKISGDSWLNPLSSLLEMESLCYLQLERLWQWRSFVHETDNTAVAVAREEGYEVVLSDRDEIKLVAEVLGEKLQSVKITEPGALGYLVYFTPISIVADGWLGRQEEATDTNDDESLSSSQLC